MAKPSAAKPSAGYTSQGIGKISSLAAFLPEFERFCRIHPGARKPDAVIGWGYKPTSVRARRYAHQHGLPYIALEDGFIRSLGLGVHGFQPHSMIADYTGIYYDARQPSDLENYLNQASFSDAELARARHCIRLIRDHRLSKYNHAPDQFSALIKARVLVVDQTAGDASIEYGNADAQRFTQMLDHALANHPEDTILVKVHPDVIAGKKQGHLTRAHHHPRCRVISDDINPWALFDQVDSVYVVTSQLGFEALLAGKQVHCFGQPFFSGWGLTHDQLPNPRRVTSRSMEEIFCAAYLRYTRYANPYTGQPSTLEATIALIADQKRQQQRLGGRWLACGFSGWKQRFVDHFLGQAATVTHVKALPAALPGPALSKPTNLLAWSSAIDESFDQRYQTLASSQDTPPRLWRMEDGFIRSVGLGVDLTTPLSLVVDSQGIYYDPRQPSDLETLLSETTFTAELVERAARLRERLVALKLTKYNVAGDTALELPDDRSIILVPGQVESDASIATGSPEISTNSALLREVRRRHPEAFIVYKGHPDVISGARIGALDTQAKHLYDFDASHIDITLLLERVDAVHTMSSLTGFEALLRHRQVATYGLPFYAGWGLTRDAMHCPRRGRMLSLDELVAATLLLYPCYVDPRSQQLCNAETVVSLLEQTKAHHPTLTWKQRLYRVYRHLLIGSH